MFISGVYFGPVYLGLCVSRRQVSLENARLRIMRSFQGGVRLYYSNFHIHGKGNNGEPDDGGRVFAITILSTASKNQPLKKLYKLCCAYDTSELIYSMFLAVGKW